MAHVRTQIRARFKTVLEQSLGSTYKVFASRKFRRNNDDKAVVDMRFLNENITQETMGDDRQREASLYIRVQRNAAETDLDDLLDADEVAITSAIEQADFSDLLEEDPELVQVNFSDDAESNVAIGAIILRYDVEYRVDKANPEVVRE